ncbi:MAG: class I SAM-dependent methyltransferase [bacterium]
MTPFLEPILFCLRFAKIKKYIPKAGRVCDICCGAQGQLLFEVKDLIVEGVGYDKEVNEQKTGNITLKKTELLGKIPEESDHFDCITMLAALEHLGKPEEILKECLRILKPGGLLLLTTPDLSGRGLLEFLSLKLGIVSREQIRGHVNYFSRETLSILLAAAGFEKDKIIIEKFEFGYNLFARAFK